MMDTAQVTPPTVPESGPIAVVQLYDTILLHVSHAANAARAKDFTTQFDEVMKATRILDGLNRHLDMAAGGQVAINMRDMYQATSRALLRSVGKDSAGEACDRLMVGLRDTRNAWAEISGMPLIPV
jgi:flagellar biosynthetic protein FliS